MYTLLIVDDEPIITDGLYELFKNQHDLELDVYRAYSGREALQKLEKIKADIVLTDIRMPDIDGLQLQEQIIQRWPRCKVIFLTGFADFSYAKMAIRNNGYDYILKTEGDDAIIRAVKKALCDIKIEEQNRKVVEIAHAQLDKILPLLQREFLTDLLYGVSFTEDERRQKFKAYQIPLNAQQPFLLLVGRINNLINNSTHEMTKILIEIQHIIYEYFPKFISVVGIPDTKWKLVWFIQPSLPLIPYLANTQYKENVWKEVSSIINLSLNSLQDRIRNLLGVSISFAFSTRPCNWEELRTRYEYLDMMTVKGLLMDKETILTDLYMEDFCKEIFSYKDSKNSVIVEIKNNLKLMELYLETGQKNELNNLLDRIAKIIETTTHLTYSIIIEVFYSISLVFLSYLNKIDLIDTVAKKINITSLTKIEEYSSWKEICEYFKNLSRVIFEERQKKQNEDVNRIVTFINNYINAHLNEDLSLTRLAELVYFSPSYLSRFYKQVTGENITDYIARVRIARAKELINTTNMKINEIALAVGFDNPSYFTRFFKKMTGMSPQEYRYHIEKTST